MSRPRRRKAEMPLEDVLAALERSDEDGDDNSVNDEDYRPSDIEDSEVDDAVNDEVEQEAGVIFSENDEAEIGVDIDRGTRKKGRNEDKWKRNVTKKQFNTGERGKHKNDGGRRIRPACGPKCRLKCTTKMTEQERQHIHDNFWAMNDKSRRRDFVVAHVNRFEKKRCTVESDSRRKFSATYNLPKGTIQVSVCKTFFLNTLDISDFMITYNLDRSANGNGIIPQTPKRVPKNKTPNASIEGVIAHINSFPRVESHFCRHDSKREYLEATLNIKMLYRLFVEHCQKANLSPVKETMYRKIFVENFNIGFHKPGKDICDTCTRFEVLKENDSLSKEQQSEWDLHLQRKAEARDSKNIDKQHSDSRITGIFDLQQVLSAPRINVGSAYYLRKLSVYNLTVLNVNSMHGQCFTWNESIAGRGANEISSVLHLWLNEQDKSGVKQVILYSDTCGGQNRNIFFCTAIVHFLSKSKYIESVEQKFFDPGHSQNECDSMHSCIEASVRKTYKIELPSQYILIMKTANKKQPYEVTEILRKDFLDFEKLNELAFKQNAFNGIMSVRHIVYKKNNKDVTISFSETIGGEQVEKPYRKRGSQVKFEQVKVECCYHNVRPIDKNKKVDVVKLCEYLSPDCRVFYESLECDENEN